MEGSRMRTITINDMSPWMLGVAGFLGGASATLLTDPRPINLLIGVPCGLVSLWLLYLGCRIAFRRPPGPNRPS